MSTARLRWFLVSILVVSGCSGNASTGSQDLGSGGNGRNGSGGGSGSEGQTAKGGSNGNGGVPGSGDDNAMGGVSGRDGFGGGSIATGGSIGSGGTGAAGTGDTQGPGTDAGKNVVPVIVDNGPNQTGSQDVPFIAVTVCVPGTTTCATVDHVGVDTGSTGLRLIATALPGNFTLPQQTTGGSPETECFTFADGYVWGSVRLADLKIGGESASNMQLQLIGDPAYPTIPSDCQATGIAEDTVGDFGGNGIIGISQSLHDCGSYCTKGGAAGYYSCHGSNCTGVTMPLVNQITNPVTLFGIDNNGAVLTFPTVPETGAATLSGTLTFGVGTQADNALGSAHMLTVDADNNLTTVYNGTVMTASFIDSGTNSLSFNDNSLAQCNGQEAGFYCPPSPTMETATITGRNNVSTMITYSVANADTLFRSRFSAFDNLAGTGDNSSFDWGFPFFIGRTVFVGLASPSSPGGNGYVAY